MVGEVHPIPEVNHGGVTESGMLPDVVSRKDEEDHEVRRKMYIESNPSEEAQCGVHEHSSESVTDTGASSFRRLLCPSGVGALCLTREVFIRDSSHKGLLAKQFGDKNKGADLFVAVVA